MIIHEMYELKMYEFKIYGGVICHENEKRCKIGRGNSSKNLQIIEDPLNIHNISDFWQY